MSEYTPEFREPFQQFFNFSLSIVNPHEIEEYIRSHDGEHIHLGDGIEKGPISFSQIWCEDNDGQMRLNSLVETNPLLPIGEENWDEAVHYALQRDMSMILPGLEHIEVPHDTATSYYGRPGQYHAFAVTTGSNLNSCGVHVETIPQEDIYNAIDVDPDTLIDEYTGVSAATITDHATLWAQVQDIVIDAYSNNPTKGTAENTVIVQTPSEMYGEQFNEPTPAVHHDSEMYASADDPFDSIGGLFEAKQLLKEYIDIFQDPEMAAEYGVNAPAFILYGAPGTGKTSLMEAFAEASDAEYRKVTAEEIQNAYIGQTSKNIEKIFKAAFNNPRQIVLCFDEIDRYLRGDLHAEFQIAAKTFGIMVEEAEKHPHVLIAAATNAPPDKFIGSIVRPGRFEIVRADAPQDDHERTDIWRAIVGRYALNNLTDPSTGEQIPLFVSSLSLEDIRDDIPEHPDALRLGEYGKYTNGMTGADIQAVVNRAKRDQFMRRRADGVVRSISHQDILRAIANYKAIWRPTTDE